MNNKITSNWTDSEITSNLVRKQILERWGEEEAGKPAWSFNPLLAA
jgi:hypothetical protein